jgi:sugar diacid utilization regulator
VTTQIQKPEQILLDSTGAAQPKSTDLGALCATLGANLIEIFSVPNGTDVRISGVILHDAVEPIDRDRMPGRLLLTLGLPRSTEEREALVRTAVAAGAAAVACRNVDLWPPSILGVAEAGGLSLLKVPDNVDLGGLFELIRAALAVGHDPIDDGVGRFSVKRPGDLFELAEMIAAMAGGPVTIDDTQSRILAFSAVRNSHEVDEARLDTILNRRAPDRWLQEARERGIIDHLLKSDDVMHVPSVVPGKRARRVIAIRLGASVIGSIWLAGEDETLHPEADAVLRSAAPLAALQVKLQSMNADLDRQVRWSSVATLLHDGSSSPAALTKIGLSDQAQLVVLSVEAAARHASTPSPVGPRIVNLLTMALQSYDPPSISALLEGEHSHGSSGLERIYVLANAGHPRDRSRLNAIMTDCVGYAQETVGVTLRVGMGLQVESAAEIPLSRGSADESLQFAPHDSAVTMFEAIHDQSLLAEVRNTVLTRRSGASRAYASLVEYDAAHETDYVETLLAALDSFGSAILVAQRLHLHVNSARYRIKRISEITGVDFRDGEARLALELEARARAAQRLS